MASIHVAKKTLVWVISGKPAPELAAVKKRNKVASWRSGPNGEDMVDHKWRSGGPLEEIWWLNDGVLVS